MHNNIYQNKKQQKSHYVYLIYNKREKKHYIGVRSCKGNPIDDIGIRYFSSSYDEQFMTEQKEYPDNFYYKVLKTFKTRDKANEYEEQLLLKVNAHNNPRFYNRAINKETFCSFNVERTETQLDALKITNYKYDYKIFHEDGRISKTNSLNEFARENGYNRDCLLKVKQRKHKTHKDIFKVEAVEVTDEHKKLLKKELEDKRKPIEIVKTYKIYFENGNVIETNNLNEFARENNYSQGNLYSVQNKIRRKHKDIIKIELYEDDVLVEIEDKLPHIPKVHYLIYHKDGKISETNNLTQFARENGYSKNHLIKLKNKNIRNSNDIIKIDQYEDGVLVEIEDKLPHIPKIHYKIYFEDGRVIDVLYLTQFASENGYDSSNLYTLRLNKLRKYKDIINVEMYKDNQLVEVENSLKYIPEVHYLIFHKCGKIDKTFNLTEYAKDNNYRANCLCEVKNKNRRYHKDIIKIERFEDDQIVEVKSDTPCKPLVSYKIYFEDGRISETENLKRFSEENGYDYKSVHSVKSKKQKTYKDIINIDTVELMLFTQT